MEAGGGRRSPQRLRDTIIEVIDTGTDRVIARTRLDEVAIAFSAPGHFYTYSESGPVYAIDIWRLTVLSKP